MHAVLEKAVGDVRRPSSDDNIVRENSSSAIIGAFGHCWVIFVADPSKQLSSFGESAITDFHAAR